MRRSMQRLRKQLPTTWPSLMMQQRKTGMKKNRSRMRKKRSMMKKKVCKS